MVLSWNVSVEPTTRSQATAERSSSTPDNLTAWALRGSLYYRKGDWPNIFKDLEQRRSTRARKTRKSPTISPGVSATCPDLRYRDQKRAVELAELAVKLVPGSFNYWNTLGVVRYRASDWAGSVQATLNSMRRYASGERVDWFVLAMAEWRLGENRGPSSSCTHAERRLSQSSNRDPDLVGAPGGSTGARRHPRQCCDLDRSWHAG